MAKAEDVDIEALRQKYSRPKSEIQAEAAVLAPKMQQRLSTELPNPVVMCQNCQAHGTVKKQYGFRVMDETCEVCGGEGCIVKKPTPASDELRSRIATVEAKIAEASSLEELEKLEAALKAGDQQSLDAVLRELYGLEALDTA